MKHQIVTMSYGDGYHFKVGDIVRSDLAGPTHVVVAIRGDEVTFRPLGRIERAVRWLAALPSRIARSGVDESYRYARPRLCRLRSFLSRRLYP